MSAPNDVTVILRAAARGDADAFDQLYKRVYNELHRLAHKVRRNRAGETLNTTALVHEAYLKLDPSRGMQWNDRVHFFRVAARAMRQVLINAAEKQVAAKRGGGEMNITFEEDLYQKPARADELVALDEALKQLERLNKRQAEVIECRYFAGLTQEETAAALGVSVPTVKRDWRLARAWLGRILSKPPSDSV